MGTVIHETQVDSEFLSAQDVDFISELVSDYLIEKGVYADSFSFSIDVSYVPGDGDD